MQLAQGVHIQLVYDQGRFTAFIDGALRLQLSNTWCIPASAGTPFCTEAPTGAGHTFGALRIAGGVGAADVSLDHVRLYAYALPVDDLGAEAVCTYYGDCGKFGVANWEPAQLAKAVPPHPFVPPALRYVAGAGPHLVA